LSKAQAVAFQNQVHILTTLDRFDRYAGDYWLEAFEELEEVTLDTTQCPGCVAKDNLGVCRGSILVLAMMLAGKTDVASQMYRLHDKRKNTEYMEWWISRFAVEIQRSIPMK
jgi:hypothetical protein